MELAYNHLVDWVSISQGSLQLRYQKLNKPNDVHHIVNHSDSVLLFTGEQIFDSLDPGEMPNLKVIFSLPDYSIRKTNISQFVEDVKKLWNN